MAGTEVKWLGEIPSCNFCVEDNDLSDVKVKVERAKYDGKTIYGPWAYMCQKHFMMYGMGLGEGRGQKLIKKGGE
jgi:hypothetical protein